jgi:hypothetical protein
MASVPNRVPIVESPNPAPAADNVLILIVVIWSYCLFYRLVCQCKK